MRFTLIRMTWVLVGLASMLASCNLTASAPTLEPTPDLPQVRFIAPANGAAVPDGTTIIADIAAEDNTMGIARIEFYVDGDLIQEGFPQNGTPPVFRVEMDWLAKGVGSHTFSAIAYRANEIHSDETTILIEVVPSS